MSTSEKLWEVVRVSCDLDAEVFKQAVQLPPDVVLWRIRNTDNTTLVYVSIDEESPKIRSERGSVIELEPEQADAPYAIPALMGKAITVYVARATTTTTPVVEIVYTRSKDPKVMQHVVIGMLPVQLGPAVAISLSGVNVQVSGSPVQVSGQVVQVSGQAVQVSGQVVQVSGQVLQVSVSGNNVQVSGQSVMLGAPNLGLVYSGIVSFVSGAVSGTSVTVGISVPAIESFEGKYIVDVWHGISGTNLTVNVNRIMAFGTDVRHVSLTTITISGPTSGVSTVVQGMFRGGVTGELIAETMGTAVVPYTGEINI